MTFKLKSGNTTSFKSMGSSPAKQTTTHYKDGTKKSEREIEFSKRHEAEKAKEKTTHPKKGQGKLIKGGQNWPGETEGQDENKIFNDKGEHVGDWVGDKKVMHTDPKAENLKPKINFNYIDSKSKAKSSPNKHTRSRGGHTKKYGKDHTNKDHPNYWKGGIRSPKIKEQMGDAMKSMLEIGVSTTQMADPIAKAKVSAITKKKMRESLDKVVKSRQVGKNAIKKSPAKHKKGKQHSHADPSKKYHTQKEFETKSEKYFDPKVVTAAKEARKNK